MSQPSRWCVARFHEYSNISEDWPSRAGGLWKPTHSIPCYTEQSTIAAKHSSGLGKFSLDFPDEDYITVPIEKWKYAQRRVSFTTRRPWAWCAIKSQRATTESTTTVHTITMSGKRSHDHNSLFPSDSCPQMSVQLRVVIANGIGLSHKFAHAAPKKKKG